VFLWLLPREAAGGIIVFVAISARKRIELSRIHQSSRDHFVRRRAMLTKICTGSMLSFCVAFGIFLFGGSQRSLSAQQPQSQQTITVPFILDHNRVFVDLEIVKLDNSIHKARAFVDMGDQHLVFTESLAKELQLDQPGDKDLRIRIAGTPLVFDQGKITAYGAPGDSIMGGGEPHIEANFPATIMMSYDVLFDYSARTMTLAPPGSIHHQGVRIPCRVNSQTGLISVDIKIGAQTYAVTIDNGSAYTWIAKSVVQEWANSHPEWLLGFGAIGNANMNGSAEEASALLARLPLIQLGPLELNSVGLAGYAMQLKPSNEDIFDWYSKKAPQKVVGFLGGNVLKSFRIEIDYANHETYWSQQSPIDPHDLDQVPLTIRPDADGSYAVVGVFTRNGNKQMAGVESGDKLIKIGDLAVKGATFGAVLDALHGQPGATRTLVLERNGKQFTRAANVIRF
jgi:hypothetical protein